MTAYRIDLTAHADKGVQKLKKSEPAAYQKLRTLLKELEVHPYSGTGKPELLKGRLSGFYSRRISKKHRLIYKVEESIVLVLVVSAYGHYDDK